jgi:hypothetical protein
MYSSFFLHGFLDGNHPCLVETIINDNIMIVNQAYNIWVQQDELHMTLIALLSIEVNHVYPYFLFISLL